MICDTHLSGICVKLHSDTNSFFSDVSLNTESGNLCSFLFFDRFSTSRLVSDPILQKNITMAENRWGGFMHTDGGYYCNTA